MDVRTHIEDVLARYAWAFDLDELDGVGDCFTADVEVEFRDGLAVGRDAVVANLERRRALFRERQVAPWHVVTSHLIREEDATRVDVGSFYTVFTQAAGAAPEVRSIGRYEDRFVNDDGTWRIRSRTVLVGGKI